MTDLDAAAARANERGLAPAALKAEKRRQREERRRAFWAAVGRSLAWCWAHMPVTLGVVVVSGLIIAATAFDWFMSSRGWLDILPGLGLFAGFGAAASVGFWYFGVHRAWQLLEKKRWGEAGVWAAVAAAGFVICVGGVVLASLTNTSAARQSAKASREAYALLVADRDTVATTLDLYSVDFYNARLTPLRRTLKAQENIAKGTYGMANLDVDGACAEKLSFNQRRLCAVVNGGTDETTGQNLAGLRAEIEQAEAGLKKATADTARLQGLQQRVDGFQVETGDKTARALGEFFKGETQGDQVMLIIFCVGSALFLFGGGFFAALAFRGFRLKAVS